ncbi:hypothetical protein [Marinobacterium lutimaris]|uniref:Uncharacterized protein n=1 Tax=Marinobacterium lutimaris TaxID=568106 RepID=A0A1H5XQE6_9GAMM|nr:hypothetical protein [Marinobacterium lutimaris]SEG13610.1 hypothetical protein SAMN05444390_1011456 [Marinobacterium lutimaris]
MKSTRDIAEAGMRAACLYKRSPEEFGSADIIAADHDLLQAHIASGDMDAESIARAHRTLALIKSGQKRV